MSVKVMSRVWDDSKAEGSALLLLLAIADHCHDDGTGAWPSISTLARKIRLGERNTQYQIRKLEKMGELKTVIRGGPKGCNSYVIQVQPIAGVQPIAPVQSSVKRGAIQRMGGCNLASKTVQPIAPDPSGTIQEPSENHHISESHPKTDILLESKITLSAMFNRKAGRAFNYAEESMLVELARDPCFSQQLTDIQAFRDQMKPQDRRFFPQSIAALLAKWSEMLDRAHNAVPTKELYPGSAPVNGF